MTIKLGATAVALSLLALPATAQTAPPAAAVPEPIKHIQPSKIILVGDSTTAVFGGWGPSFCGYHVTSFMACVNLARGGRSTSNYRAEGSWDVALSEMRTSGYRDIWVLIQFGHNDQPGKPGRSTDLATEFPANLKHYVEEVRAAGAKPVLVTPLTRRSFANGKLVNDLAPWAAATRKVAAEMNVPLIDLNADSSAAVDAMGSAAADRFAEVPPDAPQAAAPTASPGSTEVMVKPMARPKLSFDHTHLGVEGADYFATMVTRELSVAVPEMRPLLVP